MRTRVIKIGNSQGVRLPKVLLEQSQLGEDVELEASENQIIIRSVKHPRHGWDEAFQAMAAKGDDQLLDQATLTTSRWDNEEWEW